MPLTKESVIETLKLVIDPEIEIDVWSMGLIYNVEIKEKNVNLVMTLTTPTCPYGPMLLEEIKRTIKEKNGAEDVDIEVTFEPPWEPSEELRSALGV